MLASTLNFFSCLATEILDPTLDVNVAKSFQLDTLGFLYGEPSGSYNSGG